ncbi:MAG: hypothetical protein U0794_18235 [Isosphaeraceae bacterium]
MIGLSYSQYQELARRAAPAVATPSGPLTRLLRARHAARWEGDLLRGESFLTVAGTSNGVQEFTLVPWTPAITGQSQGVELLADNDGATRVRLNAPAGVPASDLREFRVEWQLRGVAHDPGWVVLLALPETEVSELTLDLPSGLEPEAQSLQRAGPLSPAKPGRSLWTFVGKGGPSELRLLNRTKPPDPSRSPSLWYRSSTRFDVGESAAVATSEFLLSAGSWSARELVIELDPGLDLIEVNGPRVEDVQTESVVVPGGEAARPRIVARVRLRPRVASETEEAATTSVTVRAMTSLPDAGRWLVPSFRAVNAVWTGGTTRLSFAASRVVRRVEELAGVQSPNHTPETESKRTLVFEDQAPGPVAAIELRRPQAEVSAEVRGRVELGRGSPILDARIVWQVERGRPHDLDVTLPRTWTADRVEIEGTDLAVPWHTDSLPNGESRVRIPFPTGDWSGKGLALRLHASSDVAGGRGPFALPRVRPIDVAISDESWVAWTEAGLSLQPRSITGLAWIDPDTVSGVPVPQTTEPVASGTNRLLRPTLGWRWIAEEAEGGVDRDLAEAPPASRIELTCRATPGRIETEARILVVDGDQMIRGVDIGLVAPGLAPNAWRFFDAATAEEIRPEPLAPAQRTSVGLGGRGPAWHLSLPTPQRGRVTILARHAASWPGQGDLPLLEVPNRFHWRGELIILSARDLLTSVRPRATRTLDPEVTWESFEQATSAVWTAANRPSAGNPTERRAHAFRYDTSEAAVELSVTALQPSNVAGLVRDALLCTTLTPGYPTRHRLTLQVVPTEADSIAIELPAGSHLERVTRDGVSITPTSESPGFRVALTSLGSSDATRSLVRVVVDYRDSTPLPATSKRVRLPRPAFSMPCLAATWTIQVPSTWKPSEIGPGWSALDRLEEPGARSASPWRELLGRLGWGGAPSPELPAELLGRMAANAPPESSLWDWLVRSDAGSVPIVVDRVALASLGYGPRSPLSPRTDPGSRANDPATWLAGWGLAAVPVGRAVVLTSLKESAGLAEAGRKGTTPRAVAEAVAWGADVTERFESVARWGQENTPRGSETADTPGSRGAPLGQVSYRFVSPGWPTEGTEIRFVDEALGRTWIGLVAAMVLTVGLFARGAWRLILALGITVALGIASLTSNGGGAWTEWLLPGLAWGTLAVALIVLGGAWKKRRPLTSEQSTVTTRGLVRGSNLLVRAGLFAIPLFPWLIVPVVAQSEEPGRIWFSFSTTASPTRIDRLIAS